MSPVTSMLPGCYKREMTHPIPIIKPCLFKHPRGITPLMPAATTARDLLYPAEWIVRFFVIAMLIQIASPGWAYALPGLAHSLIYPLGYCLFALAAAGAFVVQVRVAMQFISSRRKQDVSQDQ